MNPDLLTPSEAKNENRYMLIVLLIWLAGFFGFFCGYNYARACGYEEPEPIVVNVSEAI
jgi:hypothetical protein